MPGKTEVITRLYCFRKSWVNTGKKRSPQWPTILLLPSCTKHDVLLFLGPFITFSNFTLGVGTPRENAILLYSRGTHLRRIKKKFCCLARPANEKDNILRKGVGIFRHISKTYFISVPEGKLIDFHILQGIASRRDPTYTWSSTFGVLEHKLVEVPQCAHERQQRLNVGWLVEIRNIPLGAVQRWLNLGA